MCRFIFSNVYIGDGKVTNYRLKPPFDILLKDPSISIGRAWAIHLERVTNDIISNWNPDVFDPRILSLDNPPLTGHEKYEFHYEY